MKNGICPKCGEATIYKQKLTDSEHRIYFSSFSVTSPSQYICGSCGYLERYVDDTKKLPHVKVSKQWTPVPPDTNSDES